MSVDPGRRPSALEPPIAPLGRRANHASFTVRLAVTPAGIALSWGTAVLWFGAGAAFLAGTYPVLDSPPVAGIVSASAVIGLLLLAVPIRPVAAISLVLAPVALIGSLLAFSVFGWEQPLLIAAMGYFAAMALSTTAFLRAV